jgi:hypothetical protein
VSSADAVPFLATTVGALLASSGLWLFLRQLLRNRAERERWHAAERLADRHGPDILRCLPALARELRDAPPPAEESGPSTPRLPARRRR